MISYNIRYVVCLEYQKKGQNFECVKQTITSFHYTLCQSMAITHILDDAFKTGSVYIQLCSYETAAGPVYEGKWALFKVV